MNKCIINYTISFNLIVEYNSQKIYGNWPMNKNHSTKGKVKLMETVWIDFFLKKMIFSRIT